METLYFLGIDVSKEKLDSSLTINGKDFVNLQVDNKAKCISELFSQLKKDLSSLSNLIVCVEHTGIYTLPLLNYLVKKQIKVCVEPALQIKQSQGMVRGKTDPVDARRIALYAYKNRENLLFWRPQRDCIQKLKALLVQRESMIKAKVQLEVPLRESVDFVDKSLCRSLAKHSQKPIQALEHSIASIEREIDLLVKSDTDLSQQYKLVTSVPGVGSITALNVIISSGEFNRISEPKRFACYAGVAPFQHSSGSSIRGKTRVSKMANMTMKRLLHLAAMSAIRCCQELRQHYLRKVAAGKNKMSALNAVRNKLISRIFACIRNNRPYQKTYQNALA